MTPYRQPACAEVYSGTQCRLLLAGYLLAAPFWIYHIYQAQAL